MASAQNRTPNIDKLMVTRGIVKAAIPTFTNPNNVSIITGQPPLRTGICGNYFYDRENDREIMMNSAEFLRCGTILNDLEKNGARVVVVTAKNKLLQLLTHDLKRSVGFSVEKFDDPQASESLLEADLGVSCVQDLMGRAAPDIYDPDISVYCLEAGLRLIERMQQRSDEPIVAYLSTTDFVQHKYAPDEMEALDFYEKVDRVLGELNDIGCDVALTADHGMKNKYDENGEPYVCFLGSVLGSEARVVLPITDPYVKHHGALGGYATVYVDGDVDSAKERLESARDDRVNFDVYKAKEASEMFELPIDRIGDLVVVADRRTVLAITPEFHDFEQIPRLRTHGSLSEQDVPLLSNFELKEDRLSSRLQNGTMRNFDIFDVLLNGR